MTPREKILNALREGENNAVSLCEMQKIAGLDNRSTRLVIENLRRDGVVICSSDNGYFYPKELSELKAYVNKERHRCQSIELTLMPALELLKKWECSADTMADETTSTLLSAHKFSNENYVKQQAGEKFDRI